MYQMEKLVKSKEALRRREKGRRQSQIPVLDRSHPASRFDFFFTLPSISLYNVESLGVERSGGTVVEEDIAPVLHGRLRLNFARATPNTVWKFRNQYFSCKRHICLSGYYDHIQSPLLGFFST